MAKDIAALKAEGCELFKMDATGGLLRMDTNEYIYGPQNSPHVYFVGLDEHNDQIAALTSRAAKAEYDLGELRITEQEWLDAFAGKNDDPSRMIQRLATETMDNRREIAALKAKVERLEIENERLVAVCGHAGYADYAKRVQAGEDVFPNNNLLRGAPVVVHFKSRPPKEGEGDEPDEH